VKGVLVALAVLVAFFFPPILPLWVVGAVVQRRRAGKPGFPPIPSLTRLGRIGFYTVGLAGLTLVTVTFFAATISTSTDEHIAPIVAVFTILILAILVVVDVSIQATAAGARLALERLGR
jgi:hypothetical protein